MKKSFIEIIANIGKQISEPTFIKEFEDSSILISELENIATSITDESVKDEISLDIRFMLWDILVFSKTKVLGQAELQDKFLHRYKN